MIEGLTLAVVDGTVDGRARTADTAADAAAETALPVRLLGVPTDGEPRLFPLGAVYEANRLLAAAETPIVAVAPAGTAVTSTWLVDLAEAFADPLCALVASSAAGERLQVVDDPRRAVAALVAEARRRAFPPFAVRREDAARAGALDWQLDPAVATIDLAVRLLSRRRTIRLAHPPGVEAGDPDRARLGRGLARLIRRSRSARLAAGYVGSLAGAGASASVAEAVAFARSIARAPKGRSPRAALAHMPREVARQVELDDVEPLAPSPPPKTHLMYAVGHDRLLHLYVNPSSRLRRSLREREAIRKRVAVGGVPAVHVQAEDTDALWIVEERLRGVTPRPSEAARWFGTVAEWAVGLAGEPGPPLLESPDWLEHCRDVVAASPPVLRTQVQTALKDVGALPSVHMHGDLQRRNVLLAEGRVGVVDWEGAWLRGVPGLDLVFLALLALGDQPNGEVLEALLHGGEPKFGPLSPHLRRMGVTPARLPPVLLASLATWALGEERRIARSGLALSPRPYRDLLLRYAPRLWGASGCRRHHRGSDS